MEKERDILTKFYWPKIEAALFDKGLHLRLVDMRWGISRSSSSDSQTINICLQEIDRSDIFVGLYGQRYGWNGFHDQDLQDSFDKAVKKYPWIEQCRDRSITELEFMHGHVNNPGNIPSCFCFRDKAYDDKMWKEAEERGDTRQQRFYTDSEDAKKKLENLKDRVQKTQSKTLGVAMNYKDPEEGAKHIYESVSKYIESEIISKIETVMSDREQTDLAHARYKTLRCGLYVGGQKYIDKLNEYIASHVHKYHPLAIVGPTGCGKSALLSNWLETKLKSSESKEKKEMFFYHFVGADSHSLRPRNLMRRLVEFVQNALTEDDSQIKDSISLAMLLKKTIAVLSQMEEHKDKKLVIVLDSINQIFRDKESVPLFWLPQKLPSNIRVVVSVTQGCPQTEEVLDILMGEHKAEMLSILPLTEEDKITMCSQLLNDNSKSMETNQLALVTSSPKTNHPFFLKTLINELCVAGKFRQLTEQIQDLLLSDGVLGLMEKILHRVKNDYQQAEYQGDVVEEVLCALCLCKSGIAESEFPMPQHLWAPIIYALDDFLIDKGGVIGFAFNEMYEAVEKVFMKTDDQKQSMIKMVSGIFYVEYKQCLRRKSRVELRTANELLQLLHLSQDSKRLFQVLSDIRIFEAIIQLGHFQLNSYWQSFGTESNDIAHLYMQSLDAYVDKKYSEFRLSRDNTIWCEAMAMKVELVRNLRRWFEKSKMYHPMEYIFNTEIELETRRPGLVGVQREKNLCEVKYEKACFLSETEKYKEAVKLHNEVLQTRMKLIEAGTMDKKALGKSYHGIGLCYQDLQNFDEAEECYLLCLQAQGTVEAGESSIFCNLGLISMGKGNIQEAIERFQKSIALIQDAEPNRVSLGLTYNYHNLGLAYRKLGNLDTAERYYERALRMKKTLLGQNSMDVAQSLLNLGTLEAYRKNNEKSLKYAEEALKIFKVIAPEGSYHTIMAKENVINQLTILGQYEKAEPLMKEAFTSLKSTEEGFARGLLPVYRRFIQWYLSNKKFQEAGEIAFELVKCSKCEPHDFALLHLVDSELPPGQRPKRPQSTSLDAGLQKFPGSAQILCAKLDNIFRNSPNDFMPFVSKHCGSSEDRYLFVADVLKDKMYDTKRAAEVLKEGIEKHPRSKKLAGKLATIIRKL